MRALTPLAVAALAVACAHAPDASAPATAAAPDSVASVAPSPSPSSSAATPAPAAPAAPPASATDLLTGQRAAFDACFARARNARPKLHKSTVTITFNVDNTGRATTVAFDYKHPWDDASKDCMRDAAIALQFPDNLRGKQVGTIEFTAPQ